MGVNSGLKNKSPCVVYDARRSTKSKTPSTNKSEVQPEVDYSPVRPKSTPNSLRQSLGKIPRLRPKTAIPKTSLNNTHPEVEQVKLRRRLADQWPSGRTTLIPLPIKCDINHNYATKDSSSVKHGVKQVDENNAKSEKISLEETLSEKNPCSTVGDNSSSEVDSGLQEPSPNASSITSKLKDPLQKRNDPPKTISNANQSENFPKKSSQDVQKVNQVIKTKVRDPEPIKKKCSPEKINEALKEDFSCILPIYQSEMEKIQDVWGTTIYSSLTMRSHLLKLFADVFPNLNMTQFHTENDLLFKCMGQVKEYTETEKENFFEFIKSLLKSRNSAKEEIEAQAEERRIANLYSNDWSSITRKFAELTEETRKLQISIPEEERKKGSYEKKMKEKIHEMETALAEKEKEINKLYNQLTAMKQKESSFRGNIITKLDDFNDIEANIESLNAIEQEYKKMKLSYRKQNETYKKKVDALECLLQEKKKTLKKQRNIKTQMRTILKQVETHKNQGSESDGNVPTDYFTRRLQKGNDYERDQVWIAAVKLILKGFWSQIEKLELQKNKMLVELQSNDIENMKSTASNLLLINKKQAQSMDILSEVAQRL